MRATMASAANPPKTPIRKDTIFSRRQIENLIAEGRSIVIVDGRVLKIDAFQDYHPGGDKVIKHMIGRDATDEVNAYKSPNCELRVSLADRSSLVDYIPKKLVDT